ncbi:MAG: hypothetical protein KKB30_14500 [Proteobacteria bacterium]|nr:hypothetical protein [Pseudomonadota bacterium]MBU1715564.1 hypothetical protein [Pseudomonadota bacterium]
MTKRVLIIFGVLLLCSVNAGAGTLDLSFNEYSVKADLTQVIDEDDNGFASIRLGGLYNDKETYLGSLALNVMGKFPTLPRIKLGVGIKGFVLSSENEDILAGGFGGLFRFEEIVPKLSVDGRFFYCPDILTSLDANRMMETEVKIEYALIPRAVVYVAYTNIRANMDSTGDREIDEGIRLGLHLAF